MPGSNRQAVPLQWSRPCPSPRSPGDFASSRCRRAPRQPRAFTAGSVRRIGSTRCRLCRRAWEERRRGRGALSPVGCTSPPPEREGDPRGGAVGQDSAARAPARGFPTSGCSGRRGAVPAANLPPHSSRPAALRAPRCCSAPRQDPQAVPFPTPRDCAL